MKPIQMVDLKGQYEKIKAEVDEAIFDCLARAAFINGQAVKDFQKNLENYLRVKHVIPCANGADALQVALKYDKAFSDIGELQTPAREKNSTHVFHQYTLRVKNGSCDELQKHLSEKGVPANIYYSVPLNKQEAFKDFVAPDLKLSVTETLCREVISLPIHTEMDAETQEFIIESVNEFFTEKARTALNSEPPAVAGG